MGHGVALDLDRFFAEYDELLGRGIHPKIIVSDRAQLMMPYHVRFDVLEEERLGKNSFGSTKSGIAYAYGTKTGTTDEAGRCLVSAAKNQYNYILVTLGAPVKDKNGEYYDDWYSMIDALNLYKWAFTNFEMATVVNKDEQITEVKDEMGDL